jgi:hypothetical protein
MNNGLHWAKLTLELDHWQDAGRCASFWLRDDDACQPTTALDRLLQQLRSHDAPCLLAVIPMRAGEDLASMLEKEPLVRVAMHGAWHTNHAPVPRKSEETPIERGIGAILADLSAARTRLTQQFGATSGDWYVPPWNRISKQVAARLGELGFSAISTFAQDTAGAGAGLAQLNTHVDLMDWRGGRIGRHPEAVADDTVIQLIRARQNGWTPVGILAHHLVHDAVAWSVLDALLSVISRHPAAEWCNPDDLLAGNPRSDAT